MMSILTTRLTLASLLILSLASTAPAYAQNGDGDLRQCAQPVGTLAVVEPQKQVIQALARYQLSSPTSLIRMMVQQSNCFQVVERGVAFQNMMQERDLAQSGELQQDENIGGGQMRGADFILTPNVIFSEDNAGGIGGAVGGILGRRSRAIGAIAGGLKFKEAHTSMMVSDTRSGIQVAAAEGRARKTDFRLGMIRWGGGSAAAVGGYTNTNEGKVIAASFLDNYNEIVSVVHGNADLMHRAATGEDPNVQAGAVFHAGDVLVAKIDNVDVLSGASANAQAITTLQKADEVVFLGEEQDGFVRIQTGEGAGWVMKVLIEKP